jgi:hypothetical protein
MISCILEAARKAREHSLGPLSPNFNITQEVHETLDKYKLLRNFFVFIFGYLV